jgi:hypothetical protein
MILVDSNHIVKIHALTLNIKKWADSIKYE